MPSKAYYAKHREACKTYQRAYYKEKPEYFRKYYNTEYTCDCGKILKRGGKAWHIKTKYHMLFGNKKNVETEKTEDPEITNVMENREDGTYYQLDEDMLEVEVSCPTIQQEENIDKVEIEKTV